ncbi:hypothetical protein GCM10028784_29240 [Myceligenerans cantabricum]
MNRRRSQYGKSITIYDSTAPRRPPANPPEASRPAQDRLATQRSATAATGRVARAADVGGVPIGDARNPDWYNDKP